MVGWSLEVIDSNNYVMVGDRWIVEAGTDGMVKKV